MLGWGGAGRREGGRSSGLRMAAGGESGSVRSFVLCIVLIHIVVVVIVPFVWCSVKLPLSRPPVFACFFLSILLRTPAGRGAAEWLHGPFVAGHNQTITNKY